MVLDQKSGVVKRPGSEGSKPVRTNKVAPLETSEQDEAAQTIPSNLRLQRETDGVRKKEEQAARDQLTSILNSCNRVSRPVVSAFRVGIHIIPLTSMYRFLGA